MSKMSDAVKAMQYDKKLAKKGAVTNFMGGISYEWNPVDTLKMVTASSIFGEPQYYRDGAFAKKTIDKHGKENKGFFLDETFRDFAIKALDKYNGMNSAQLMEKVIDDALSYDFGATINWANQLRHEFLIRTNPQIIMVRAAMNDAREAWTNANPGEFGRINNNVMSRADDVLVQMTYYIYLTGDKKNIPGILKRSWAQKISSLNTYQVAKYKNDEIGLINAVRIAHAKGPVIDELMQTGTVAVEENEMTWDNLKSAGKSWDDILYHTDGFKMNHMALLRNLRGIFTEIADHDKAEEIMSYLEKGVPNGKQFPFRYFSAYNEIKEKMEKDKNNDSEEKLNNPMVILDGLEDCIDKACENLPKLKGKSAFLTDNSGSAYYAKVSEKSKVHVFEISNLSSVIGAVNSEDGTVFRFGDRLIKHEISKRTGILAQATKLSSKGAGDVGGATENGIWLFFKEAISKKIKYDNIFIYSDQQAGHGGLYGTGDEVKCYTQLGYAIKRGYHYYVDVAKLIAMYRSKVNPKVNVFSIQVAGYNNNLIPENGYRTSIMYGWTGKELVYADAMNKFWDEYDERVKNREVQATLSNENDVEEQEER